MMINRENGFTPYKVLVKSIKEGSVCEEVFHAIHLAEKLNDSTPEIVFPDWYCTVDPFLSYRGTFDGTCFRDSLDWLMVRIAPTVV